MFRQDAPDFNRIGLHDHAAHAHHTVAHHADFGVFADADDGGAVPFGRIGVHGV